MRNMMQYVILKDGILRFNKNLIQFGHDEVEYFIAFSFQIPSAIQFIM